MWLFSHHTQPFSVAVQPPHLTLECGFSVTTLSLDKFHGYPATTLSFTSLVAVAIQPPLTNGQIHGYPATLFKATLTCG